MTTFPRNSHPPNTWDAFFPIYDTMITSDIRNEERCEYIRLEVKCNFHNPVTVQQALNLQKLHEQTSSLFLLFFLLAVNIKFKK